MKKISVVLAVSMMTGAFTLEAENNPLIVPKATDASVSVLPLAEGQMAYKEEDNVASLIIGGKNQSLKMVTDPYTLRGYTEKEIVSGEYLESHTSGITYSASDNTWKMNHNTTGITERIVFKLSDNRTISDCEYDSVNKMSGSVGDIECGTITVTMSGNTLTFELVKHHTGVLSVSDVLMSYIPFGGHTDVVDLTKLHISLKDTVGEGDLSQWRNDLMNYADRHHHAHEWYQFEGSNDVRMVWKDIEYPSGITTESQTNAYRKLMHENFYGNGISFAGPLKANKYKIFSDSATTNLCIKAGGVNAIEIYGADNSFVTNASLRVTGISTTNDNVYITYSSTITPFDTSKLRVMTAYPYDLHTPLAWSYLDETSYVVNGNVIVISGKTSSDKLLFKLVYGDTDSYGCAITLRGKVIVEDEITVSDFDNVKRTSDGKGLETYICQSKHADLASISSTSIVATNGVIYNASIGAGPLNVTVPSYTTGKSDSFTIRITCTSDTQLGTVQGPSGEAVTLEWLTSPLTTAGSIHSSKKMYLTMVRVDEWTFVCKGEEV